MVSAASEEVLYTDKGVLYVANVLPVKGQSRYVSCIVYSVCDALSYLVVRWER